MAPDARADGDPFTGKQKPRKKKPSRVNEKGRYNPAMRSLMLICSGLVLLSAGTTATAQTPDPSPKTAPKELPRIVVMREQRPMLLEALINRNLPTIKSRNPLVRDRVGK
jgi:hypothetical protein